MSRKKLTIVGQASADPADPTDPNAPAPAPAAATPPPLVAKYTTQMLGNFEVPYGYEIWSDGLYRVRESPLDDVGPGSVPCLTGTPSSIRRTYLERLSTSPLWLRTVGHALRTKRNLFELAFRDAISEQIKSFWVARDQISSKNQILELSTEELPITESNAKHLIDYIDKAIALNGPKLRPIAQMMNRTGSYQLPQGTGWLLGERWIGPPGTSVIADPREENSFAKSYRVEGDEDEWRRMWVKVSAYGSISRWLMNATFAAPLLRILKHRTFLIHHWGRSGSGKSALAKFAQAAWGDPAELTLTCNRTDKSYIEVFKYITDVPVLFDELQAAGKDAAFFKTVYDLTLERGRGRATKTGGLQTGGIDEWKSVVRITGEEPVIGKDGAVDLGGQSNRVVQLGTPVLDAAQASEIHRWLERGHFGWGGMRFIEKLSDALQKPGAEDAIKDRYEEFRTKILAQVSVGPVQERIGPIALVALAQYLAHRWLFSADEPPEDRETIAERVKEGAIRDAVEVAKAIADDFESQPLSARVLQLFHDDYNSQTRNWLDVSSKVGVQRLKTMSYKELTGVIRGDEVWLIQSRANELLRKGGFPPKRVWADLKEEGFLAIAGARTFSSHRQSGQFSSEVYVLRRDVRGATPPGGKTYVENPFFLAVSDSDLPAEA